MLVGTHNPLAPDAGDDTACVDYHQIQGGVAVILFVSCYKTRFVSPTPFTEGFLEGRPQQATYHTHQTT